MGSLPGMLAESQQSMANPAPPCFTWRREERSGGGQVAFTGAFPKDFPPRVKSSSGEDFSFLVHSHFEGGEKVTEKKNSTYFSFHRVLSGRQ